MRRQPKKTKLQELQEKRQLLLNKRLKAYTAGASIEVMQQFDILMDELELEIYDQMEVERFEREAKDGDDESYVV